jgi:hypothetical protein
VRNTRIGNLALEQSISRNEVGCGEGLVSKRGVVAAQLEQAAYQRRGPFILSQRRLRADWRR